MLNLTVRLWKVNERRRLGFNEHIEADGPTVFAHACTMGLEGIVSKRKGSPYRSGRAPDWLKMKNADAPGAAEGWFGTFAFTRT
jgi:ATP-dependent DNA ligase